MCNLTKTLLKLSLCFLAVEIQATAMNQSMPLQNAVTQNTTNAAYHTAFKAATQNSSQALGVLLTNRITPSSALQTAFNLLNNPTQLANLMPTTALLTLLNTTLNRNNSPRG